jgi:ABC-type bacteriocin/lantibiotic exporter with double-glycine peptidase domain
LRAGVRTRAFRQAQTTECPVAAIGIILDHYGRRVGMEELRARTGVSRHGATAADMIRVGREFGLTGRGLRAELGDLPRIGFPLVAYLRFVHFVVVERIGVDRVWLNDPAAGRYEWPIELFDRSYTGVVLKFEPGPDFVTGGKGPSLAAAVAHAITPARQAALAATAAAVLLALPTVIAAVSLGRLVDRHFAGNGLLAGPALALAAAALVAGALGWSREVLLARVARRLAAIHTDRLLTHVRSLPFAFFTYRLPDELARLVRAPARLAELATGRLGRAALDALGAVPLGLALASYHATAAAAITALAAAEVLAAWAVLRPRSQRFLLFLRNRSRKPPALAFEQLEMKKTGGLDDELFADLVGDHAESVTAEHDRPGRWTLAAALPRLVDGLALLAALGGGGLALVSETGGPGAVVAMTVLSLALVQRAHALAADEGDIADLVDGADPLLEVTALPPEPPPSPREAEGAAAPPGALRLERVSFGYALGKAAVVRDVSVAVQPGDSLGISGASGSGKSTLAGLLAGIHRPWSGRALAGDTPLTEIPPAARARTVAWVHRTPALFAGSLRDNLTLFDEAISDDALRASVRDACLDEAVSRRGGLGARVASRGVNLSGGERQRLEIARALARNPAFIVLDEATDALEPPLEERIRANIRRRGCGLVVVSHRASTLAACDAVVTLQAGRLHSGGADPLGDDHAAAGRPAGVIHGDHPRRLKREDSEEHRPALAEAFRLVAAAAGEQAPIAATPLAGGPAGVADLARRSGLRARCVRLVRRDWWRRDNGPLLAFSADGRPLPLVPGRGGGHSVLEPGDGRARPLTATDASGLREEAYAIYGRLADEAARPSDLLRFALVRVRDDLARALVAGLAAGLLTAAAPLAAVVILREAGPLADRMLVAQALASVAVLAVAAALVEADRVRRTRRAEARAEHLALAAAADRLARLPASFLRRHAPALLARRWSALVEAFDLLGGRTLQGFAAAIPGALAGLLVLALLSPALAGLAGALVGGLVLLAVRVARPALGLDTRRSAQAHANGHFLFDMLRGMGRLRSLDVDGAVARAWRDRHRSELQTRFRLRCRLAATRALEEAFPLAALAILVGAARLAPAGFEPVQLAALLLVSLPCWSAGVTLARSAVEATLAAGPARRYAPLLAVRPEGAGRREHPGHLRGHVETRGLAFAYDDSRGPTLTDVSLAALPGEVVAIAGASGSGKSTLLRLLLGLEEPHAGAILYDGVHLSRLDLAAVRAQVGAVFHEDQLAVGTLFSNLVGHSRHDLDDVWEAARNAAIDREIRSWPMGVQTILEDDRVSTGQKQRLLLAARLVRQPRIVLLDEATSALPEQVQRDVFRNLRTLGVTCVLAAHRASATVLADRVYVLEGGRVVESGSPAELLARGGALSRLMAHERNGHVQRVPDQETGSGAAP